MEELLNKLKNRILVPVQVQTGKLLTVLNRISQNRLYANIYTLAVFPAVLLFLVELIHRQNILSVLLWLILSPMEVILSYILTASIFFLILSIFGRVGIMGSAALLVLILTSLASSQKKLLVGDPLLPWDIFLFRQVSDLVSYILNGISIFNFLMVLLTITLFFMLFVVSKPLRYSVWLRLILGTISLLIISSMCFDPRTVYTMLPKVGITNIDWVQSQNYDKNGFVSAFMMNVKNVMIQKPDIYNKEILLSKIQDIQAPASQTDESFVRPNVIMVMNEAFWDPTEMESVSFSRDPMPTVRSLMKSHSSGRLISPSYGGGTANVEFEVLTGNSVSFLPEGSNPYQQYITKPIPSLAGIFSEYGYNSVAIHSYHRWFFNRERVYDLIGFEKFISAEDFKDPAYKGFYISDEEVSKMIINEHKNSDRPLFIYAITMQNHGPYDVKRYESIDIELESDKLTDRGRNILEDYTHGVSDADSSLQTLIDYFEKVEQPTVIVFFGDHLPMLGKNYSVYYETGFVNSRNAGWSSEEYMRLHSTPLLFWTNYPHSKENLNDISTCYLGSYLMDFIGMEKPLYFRFLDHARSSMPVNLRYLKMDSNKTLFSQTPAQLAELESTHWLFQYDIMFGKGYLKEAFLEF